MAPTMVDLGASAGLLLSLLLQPHAVTAAIAATWLLLARYVINIWYFVWTLGCSSSCFKFLANISPSVSFMSASPGRRLPREL